MCRPPACNSQCCRSSDVACTSRGYQDRGTVINRPSARLAVSVSSVVVTDVAIATAVSICEELIPGLKERCLVALYGSLNASQLRSREVAIRRQCYGPQLHLRKTVIALDVNVWRLTSIARQKVVAETTVSEDRWHLAITQAVTVLRRPYPETTDNSTRDARSALWWTVFSAILVCVCRPNGSPVLGLTSNLG